MHKIADACLAPDAGLLECRTSTWPDYRDCTVYENATPWFPLSYIRPNRKHANVL
jgi:hypothetical protein